MITKYIFVVLMHMQLAPSDVDIFKAHKQEIIEARQYARKMSMAILVDKDEKDENKDKEKDKDDQVSPQFSL